MPLRVRLSLWWGGLTGLVVLVVGLLAYAAESLTLYNDVDLELRQAAERAASSQASLVAAPGGQILAASSRPGLAIWLYGPGGEVLAASPHAELRPTTDPRTVLERPSGPAYDPIVRFAPPYTTVDPGAGAFGLVTGPDGLRWRVYAVPLGRTAAAGARPAMYAVSEAPLRDIDAAAATSRRLVPLLAGAGAVAMLAAGGLLASRALRPVAALTETADAIARARELGRRVPVGERRDELGQMAATFNAMLDSLERAHLTQQRFVADASHELRTPLTTVLANLEFLERQEAMSPEARREAVEEASRETRRLVRLVADLLALARADAGLPLSRQRVPLEQLLLEVLAQAKHLTRGHDVRVEELASLEVDGDPDRLRQLLLILLDNAIRYTPASGTITLELRRRGGMAEITIRDTGIGIAVRDLPRVFERFFRAAPARARDPEGTGLGLAIAQWIAGQHGGEVSIASQGAGGATATVHLPLARERGADLDTRSRTRARPAPAGATARQARW